MLSYINELSFSPEFEDSDDALKSLREFIELTKLSPRLSNLKPTRRHKKLADLFILNNITLRVFIFSLGKSMDPKLRDLSTMLFTSIVQGPYCENIHTEGDVLTDDNEVCKKDTCIDEAISHYGGAALLSLNRGTAQPNKYEFKSSKFGAKKLRNFFTLDQVASAIWHYQPNDKHNLKKDKVIEGLVHSAMLLRNEEAQKVLTNGVMCGKSVFSKVGEQWYKFHCHEANLYHGFPITPKTPSQDFSNAVKFLKSAGENHNGQFFYEDIE